MWLFILGAGVLLSLARALRSDPDAELEKDVVRVAKYALEHETDWQVLWHLANVMDVRSTQQKFAGADPKTTLPDGWWPLIFALHNRAVTLSGSTNVWK